jgi:molybdopterin converting factor small subunit
MRDRLCDGRPALRRHITIFVDGERAALDTEVGPQSEVDVIPAISGG